MEITHNSNEILDDTSFKSLRKSSNFLSLLLLFVFCTRVDLSQLTLLGTINAKSN